MPQGIVTVPAYQNNVASGGYFQPVPDPTAPPGFPPGQLWIPPSPGDTRPFTATLGFALAAGQSIRITPYPTASWTCDPGRGPMGIGGNGDPAPPGDYPLPNAVQWCPLVRTTGPDAEWIPLTGGAVVINGPFANLFFIPNDDKRYDNSGSVQIAVEW